MEEGVDIRRSQGRSQGTAARATHGHLAISLRDVNAIEGDGTHVWHWLLLLMLLLLLQMMLGGKVRWRARARKARATQCAAKRLLLEEVAHL